MTHLSRNPIRTNTVTSEEMRSHFSGGDEGLPLPRGGLSLEQLYRLIQSVETRERRRLAGELHDSLSPNLVAMQLQLQIMRSRDDGQDPGLYGQMEACLAQTLRAVRTLSYLMHPPEIMDGGLVTALDILLKGFEARTGISVDFRHRQAEHWWTTNAEAVFFRVAQEAFTNIHNHAQATTVQVSLTGTSALLTLKIRDNGIGLPSDIGGVSEDRMGVGLSSMKERVEAISGDFAIRSTGRGTEVTARLARWPELLQPS